MVSNEYEDWYVGASLEQVTAMYFLQPPVPILSACTKSHAGVWNKNPKLTKQLPNTDWQETKHHAGI